LPAIEARFTIVPRMPRPTMTRAAAWPQKNTPSRFTARVCRRSAALTSRKPCIFEIPAFDTQTLNPPCSSATCSATAAAESGSVTSSRSALPP
jgi:hypothetical protein